MAEVKTPDINAYLWPYFDSGLLLKLIDFYIAKGTHDKRALLAQKLKTLSFTMMDSAARSAYKELNGNENYPACNRARCNVIIAYEEHLKKVGAHKADLEKALEPLLKSAELVDMIKDEKLFNAAKAKSAFPADDQHLGTLFDYAKFLYDCGMYTGTPSPDDRIIDALNFLGFFRKVSSNKEKTMSALWGQLGCCIMLDQGDKAVETLGKLKEGIEAMVCSECGTGVDSRNGPAQRPRVAAALGALRLLQGRGQGQAISRSGARALLRYHHGAHLPPPSPLSLCCGHAEQEEGGTGHAEELCEEDCAQVHG